MNREQQAANAAGHAAGSQPSAAAGAASANSSSSSSQPANTPNSVNVQQQQAPRLVQTRTNPPAGGLQLHNLRPNTSAPRQPISATPSVEPAATEQSAFEMAQSAAARVTGSAAAAIAAAKFKMLRSNTLAAAFGRPAEGEEPEAPLDLVAVRTSDERVVNTLTASSALKARQLKLDAK